MRKLALCASLIAAVVTIAAPLRAQDSASAEPRTIPVGQPILVDRVVAVVGDQPILWSDVMAEVNQRRAGGMRLPPDSAGQLEVARGIVRDLIDVEILVQRAKVLGLEVGDAEVASAADRQVRSIRSQFRTEDEFRSELRTAGFGTPEEYRRTISDQIRRHLLQQRAFEELRGQVRPVSVTEDEITAAFERSREQLGNRPATVTFRQIVVAPKPTADAKDRARAKAESLLVEIRRGGDFEQIARRESMDPGSRELGGDLGWSRRGGGFVPEFERVVFALQPGHVSPVIETSFGYHIIRVDRVQPAEVKSRHILIRPEITDADVAAARDTAANVVLQWRAGADFETLVARYHDPAEERGILQPFPRDSLPASYQGAILGKQAGEFTEPFALGQPPLGLKYAVLELVGVTEGGQYSITEVREQIRAQLVAEKSARQLLDDLRRRTFVVVRLDE